MLCIKEINRAIYSVTFTLRESASRINGGPSLHSFPGLFLLIFFSLSLSFDANKRDLHDKYSRRVATENVSSTVVCAIDNFDNGRADPNTASCRSSLLASLGDPDRFDLFSPCRDPYVEKILIISRAFRRADHRSVIDSNDLNLLRYSHEEKAIRSWRRKN